MKVPWWVSYRLVNDSSREFRGKPFRISLAQEPHGTLLQLVTLPPIYMAPERGPLKEFDLPGMPCYEEG